MLKSPGVSGDEKVLRKTKPADRAAPRVYFHVRRLPSARPAAPVSGGHWGAMQGEPPACKPCSRGFCGTRASCDEVLPHAQVCENESILGVGAV